jgi:iron complex transport system substrate-binding protein
MSARLAIRLLFPSILFVWSAVCSAALFMDGMGREVSVDSVPKRIVTLAPSITEIVYFLGMGERVVGVTKYSSYPPDAASKPKVGSYVDVNVEQIVSLSPDLVIGTADGNRPAVVEMLEKAGIPVFVVHPRNLRQVIQTIVDIGEVCGVADRARALAGELSARVDSIAAKTAGLERPLVFLQVNPKPIMTVNGTTYSSDLIRLAGGRNMADDESIAYPRISLEEVIRRKPDVIVVSSMERGGEFEEIRRQWLKLDIVPAARNGRVHLVDSDLIDRPSPRVVDGLEILARQIHPDLDWNE